MLDHESLEVLLQAVQKLDSGFAKLPDFESNAPGMERLAEVLAATNGQSRSYFPGAIRTRSEMPTPNGSSKSSFGGRRGSKRRTETQIGRQGLAKSLRQ